MPGAGNSSQTRGHTSEPPAMPCLASWNNSNFNRSCITTPVEALAFRKTPWAALRAPQRGQTKPFRGRGRTLLHPDCETQSLPVPVVPPVKAPLECPQVLGVLLLPCSSCFATERKLQSSDIFHCWNNLFFLFAMVFITKKKKKEHI